MCIGGETCSLPTYWCLFWEGIDGKEALNKVNSNPIAFSIKSCTLFLAENDNGIWGIDTDSHDKQAIQTLEKELIEKHVSLLYYHIYIQTIIDVLLHDK